MGDRSAFTRDDKNKKEGRQCTYNVILLRVRVTAVATEMQECFPFVSLSYMGQQCNK